MTDYGCSSELGLDDERQAEWKKQREERGFDSTELWNLDVTIARFIVPRLKLFVESEAGVPGYIDPHNKLKDKGRSKWKKILKEMLEGFEIIADDESLYDPIRSKKAEKAVKLLAKHYFALWN